MVYNFDTFNASVSSVLEWLKKEYVGIRTARATPSILDGVSVEAYGSRMPISQLATISVDGPTSMRITPWDKEVVKDIDRAIRESNLGLSVSIDDIGLRVNFPLLTSERRVLLIKHAKEKFEEARITLRTEREKTITDIEKREKQGELTEDDRFRLKGELQKNVEESNKKLEMLFDTKQKEIEE